MRASGCATCRRQHDARRRRSPWACSARGPLSERAAATDRRRAAVPARNLQIAAPIQPPEGAPPLRRRRPSSAGCTAGCTPDEALVPLLAIASLIGSPSRSGQVGVALELLEVVDGLDAADGARAGAHDQRLGGGAVREVVDALDQLAVGDAGQGEEDVAAAHQVVDGQHLIQASPSRFGLRALVVVARPQLALDVAAQALQRGGGEDRLGRAADAQQHVDARVGQRRHQAAGHVAVGDQLDPRARGADAARSARRGGVDPARRPSGRRRARLWRWPALRYSPRCSSRASTRRDRPGRPPASPCTRCPAGSTSCRARPARRPTPRWAGPWTAASCHPPDRPPRRPAAAAPLPMRSPMYSIGASSFSPSPMTTTPSISITRRRSRMALTAA